MRPRKAFACAAIVVAAFGLGSCNKYNQARGRGDAPVGRVDRSAKDIIDFPDQFHNVATSCDGHGHRIYVTTHGSNDPGSLYVINDEGCSR